jgi:hypothetical protein
VLKRRYPWKTSFKENRVTIALGIIASNGIVIATDTQITQSDFLKAGRGKMVGEALDDGESGAILLSGSGTIGYVESFNQQIAELFKSKRPSLETLDAELRNKLRTFYRDHVAPFSSYEPHDRPEMFLLAAAQRDGEKVMWTSEKSTIRKCYFYEAVGAGAMYANIVMNRLISWLRVELDIFGALILASYVIFQVKEHIDGCGKETHIGCIHDNTLDIFAIGEGLEEDFKVHAEIETDSILSVLGVQPSRFVDATRNTRLKESIERRFAGIKMDIQDSKRERRS